MNRVFILYDHLLFARGLERLLKEEVGVEVVGLGGKEEKTFGHLMVLKPDVVVIEGEQEEGALLLRLLKEQPQARIARVSLGDSTASLYFGRHWTAIKARELVEGILP